jgi:hypothetical protein
MEAGRILDHRGGRSVGGQGGLTRLARRSSGGVLGLVALIDAKG